MRRNCISLNRKESHNCCRSISCCMVSGIRTMRSISSRIACANRGGSASTPSERNAFKRNSRKDCADSIADRKASAPLLRIKLSGSSPSGNCIIFTLNPSSKASSSPRIVAVCPAPSPSYAINTFFVKRLKSCNCSRVSAVPLDAIV